MSRRKNAGVSIFRRADGRWVLSYQLEPGKWRQHTLSAADERGAEKEAHRWLAEQRAAGTLRAGKTIGELWRDWIKLRGASPNLATSTVRDNESHFERDLVPFYDTELSKLEPSQIRDFVRGFRDGRSASKVRNVVSTLAAFFDDARAEGWVDAPANIVRHPAVTKELPAPKSGGDVVYIPHASAQALVLHDAVSVHRRVRYTVALLTGLRDGELQGLQWGDVRLDDEVPHLRVERAFATKASPDAYAALTDPKTDGSRRAVPLHDAALAALRWWRDVGWPFYTGAAMAPEAAVFASVNGAHWRPKSARELREDLARAGLPTTSGGAPIDFHATRRSFATWLSDAGADEATVGKLLGHVAGSTGGKHYTAVLLKRLLDAVARIPFRWQAPTADGSPPVSGGATHSASLVQTHRACSDSASAPVAQWIEQRFPNSPASVPASSFLDGSHNAAEVVGDSAILESAAVARLEARAAQFDGHRRARQTSRAAERTARSRARQDAVAALIGEMKALVVGATTLPADERAARAAATRALLARASNILLGREEVSR